MTNLEQTIMRELATLPENRLNNVLEYVRFLKISQPEKEKVRNEFKEALKDVRATARKHKITQAEIDAEIRAVREGK